MTKLSTTARAILTAAAERDDRIALAPERLPAAARRAVVLSLLKAGLLEEIAADDNHPAVLVVVDLPSVRSHARGHGLDADSEPGGAACDGARRGERRRHGGRLGAVSDHASFRFAAACFPRSATTS